VRQQIDIKTASFRIQHLTPGHVTYGIWINGAKCGNLTVRAEEQVAFETKMGNAGFKLTTLDKGLTKMTHIHYRLTINKQRMDIIKNALRIARTSLQCDNRYHANHPDFALLSDFTLLLNELEHATAEPVSEGKQNDPSPLTPPSFPLSPTHYLIDDSVALGVE
jgi:hypothetical protein